MFPPLDGQRSYDRHAALRVHCFGVFVAAAFISLLPWTNTPAASQAEIAASRLAFDIPAQELGAALKALGAAANEQVLFSERVVAGLRSPDLKGEYSIEEAIELLLEGTGLTAERTPSGVFLIRSADIVSPPQGIGKSVPAARQQPMSRTMFTQPASSSK